MRDLPLTIPVPQRVQLDDAVSQRAQDSIVRTLNAVARMALFRVVTVTTTAANQTVTIDAPIGTWFMANPQAFVQVHTVSLDGPSLTFIASAAGVTLDLVFLV